MEINTIQLVKLIVHILVLTLNLAFILYSVLHYTNT
jgi:hypothetical protein